MLTKRQKEILDFVEKHIKKKGYSPSLVEMAKKFELSSIATVHKHIENLKAKGYLKKEKNHHRSIEIQPEFRALDSIDLIEIPLLGTISAGQPIEAIENPETIVISKSQLSNSDGELFSLKVQGDSMIEDGILSGDTVIIKKQPTASNGETVAVLIDDSVTLKKFYKEKDRIRLQPANKKMKPIYTTNVEIQGKLVGIFRSI